jgi:hypothetical protein
MGGVAATALEGAAALGVGFSAGEVWAEALSVAKARTANERDAILRMTFISCKPFHGEYDSAALLSARG